MIELPLLSSQTSHEVCLVRLNVPGSIIDELLDSKTQLTRKLGLSRCYMLSHLVMVKIYREMYVHEWVVY